LNFAHNPQAFASVEWDLSGALAIAGRAARVGASRALDERLGRARAACPSDPALPGPVHPSAKTAARQRGFSGLVAGCPCQTARFFLKPLIGARPFAFERSHAIRIGH